jgi:hypothetical protein
MGARTSLEKTDITHKAQHRARMRRHRARRGKGMECFHSGNWFRSIAWAAGYLDPEKRGDRAAKARAIDCFITEYLP